MPKFAANLTLMYPQHAFLERFTAARVDGFSAVEFLFPYDYPAEQVAALLQRHQLQLALFNLPPGNWAAGERGIAALPGREAEFRASLALAIAYANSFGDLHRSRLVHIMAGIAPASASQNERNQMRRTYLANLRIAAEALAEHGLVGLIEPINTRDIPGYFINRQDHAHELVSELASVGAHNINVQMDLYHCQIVEGDVAMKLRKYLSEQPCKVAHLQIASVPERQEPSGGELNYPYLFALIDELGYRGWVGCEYRPKGDTSAGLAWLRGLV